jgi:hypothetical protein
LKKEFANGNLVSEYENHQMPLSNVEVDYEFGKSEFGNSEKT